MNIVLSFLLLAIATVALHLAPPSWQAHTVDGLVDKQSERAQTSWSLSPDARFGTADSVPELHHRATGRDGNHTWTTMSGLWPVPKEATRVRAIAYLLADTGQARIRGLELQGGKTRLSYAVAYYTVMLAWLVFAGYCARRALAGTERRLLRIATVTFAAALVVAGVAPQPYMYESVRSVTFTAQDALDSMTFAWQSLTAPPAGVTAPADAEQSTPNPDLARTAGAGEENDEASDAKSDAEDETTAKLTPPEVRDAGANKPQRQHYWEPDFPYADKLAHMGAFLALAICVAIAWSTTPWIVCITAAAGVSVSIQVLQTMTVTREFDWWDFGADLTGIIAGALCVRIVSAIFAKRQPRPNAR